MKQKKEGQPLPQPNGGVSASVREKEAEHMHEAAQCSRGGRLHNQMEMIRHETEAKYVDGMFRVRCGQQIEEGAVVAIFVKDHGTAVSAIEHVGGITGDLTARNAWHGGVSVDGRAANMQGKSSLSPFSTCWESGYPKGAAKSCAAWYFWATHSRLEPIIAAARTLKRHRAHIMTSVTHRMTNATAEGINSKIQMIKLMACGYRNREHDKTAIYFHGGGLDLDPRAAPA